MEENKQRILEVAEALFRKYGFKRVTMDDIAREMGISKKTIYQFFKDKTEIVISVMEQIFERDEQELEKMKRESESSVEEMMLVSSHFKRMVESINPVVFYDMKRYYPKAYSHFEYHKGCFREAFVKSIERGKKEGVFREDLDVEVLAKMRMYQVEMAFDPDFFPADQYNTTHVQMQLFQHFIMGLCTAEGAKKFADYQTQNLLKSNF